MVSRNKDFYLHFFRTRYKKDISGDTAKLALSDSVLAYNIKYPQNNREIESLKNAYQEYYGLNWDEEKEKFLISEKVNDVLKFDRMDNIIEYVTSHENGEDLLKSILKGIESNRNAGNQKETKSELSPPLPKNEKDVILLPGKCQYIITEPDGGKRQCANDAKGVQPFPGYCGTHYKKMKEETVAGQGTVWDKIKSEMEKDNE